MYLKLIRNKANGFAITGRLVIDGRWFCNTLERKGYEIPALCYHLAVTQSPRFKRLLPIVQNVPQRSGIRFHRGTKPQHSTGCILVVADNMNDNRNNNPTTSTTINQQHSYLDQRSRTIISARINILERQDVEVNTPERGRTSAEVEQELTQLLLQAQNNHEEIILEVIDYRPGTEYGYDHPCESVLQEHNRDAHRAEERYYQLHPEERAD